MYRRVQGQLDRIMRRVHENLLGVRVIRAFNREEKEIQSFREDTEALNQAQQKGEWSLRSHESYYVCVCECGPHRHSLWGCD